MTTPTSAFTNQNTAATYYNIPWTGLGNLSKPAVTVSATGSAATGVINAGCDFGPDTPLNNVGPGLTATVGQHEADLTLTSLGGGLAFLMNGAILTIVPSVNNVFLAPNQIGGGGSTASPSNTVTVGTSFGVSSAVGASVNYSRGDHAHGTPPAPSMESLSDWSGTASSGQVATYNGTTWGPVTPGVVPVASTLVVGPPSYGAASIRGSSTLYARQDHVHGLPAVPSMEQLSDFSGSPNTTGQVPMWSTAAGNWSSTVPVTSLTGGAGISVTSATGAITITNTGTIGGVSSLAAGAGITVSSSTGSVTVTNAGVLTDVAGTGISVSSATGNVTITNTEPFAPTAAAAQVFWVYNNGSGYTAVDMSNGAATTYGTGSAALNALTALNTTGGVEIHVAPDFNSGPGSVTVPYSNTSIIAETDSNYYKTSAGVLIQSLVIGSTLTPSTLANCLFVGIQYYEVLVHNYATTFTENIRFHNSTLKTQQSSPGAGIVFDGLATTLGTFQYINMGDWEVFDANDSNSSATSGSLGATYTGYGWLQFYGSSTNESNAHLSFGTVFVYHQAIAGGYSNSIYFAPGSIFQTIHFNYLDDNKSGSSASNGFTTVYQDGTTSLSTTTQGSIYIHLLRMETHQMSSPNYWFQSVANTGQQNVNVWIDNLEIVGSWASLMNNQNTNWKGNNSASIFVEKIDYLGSQSVLGQGTWNEVQNFPIYIGRMFLSQTASAWSSLTAYTVPNVASSGGVNYVCIVANTNNAPPNATYWAIQLCPTGMAVLNPLTGTAANSILSVGGTHPASSMVSGNNYICGGTPLDCYVVGGSGVQVTLIDTATNTILNGASSVTGPINLKDKMKIALSWSTQPNIYFVKAV
jgi:hypothetical protein